MRVLPVAGLLGRYRTARCRVKQSGLLGRERGPDRGFVEPYLNIF